MNETADKTDEMTESFFGFLAGEPYSTSACFETKIISTEATTSGRTGIPSMQKGTVKNAAIFIYSVSFGTAFFTVPATVTRTSESRRVMSSVRALFLFRAPNTREMQISHRRPRIRPTARHIMTSTDLYGASG